MARNFGVNLTRRAPSSVLRSTDSRTIRSALFSQSQADSFDEAVPSPVKARFQQRAQAYADEEMPEGPSVSPTAASCQEAYALLQGWFNHINNYAAPLESAISDVNLSVERGLLQGEFALIMQPGRTIAINSIKTRANNIRTAAQTPGLELTYDLLSQVFVTLSLGALDDFTPVQALNYIKQVIRDVEDFQDTLQDLEDTFDSGLNIPSNVQSASLPPLAKLVNPNAWADATGTPGSSPLCQASTIPGLARIPRDAGFHNVLGVIPHPGAAGNSWQEIATGVVGSEAPWIKTQQEANQLIPLYGDSAAFASAAFLFEAIGGILAALVDQFSTEEEKNESWYQALYSQLQELYDIADAVFSALSGDFSGLLVMIVAAANEEIADSIVGVEQAHEEIFKNIVGIPAALLAFQVQGTNYTPSTSSLTNYINLRNNTLSPFVADLYAETDVSTQSYSTGVYAAIKTLVACCYYNQSVYFYKNGYPGQPPGNEDAYEGWKAWTQAMRSRAQQFEQATSMISVLQEGPQSYFQENILERPIFNRQRTVQPEMFSMDLLNQDRYARRTGRRRGLGGILPVDESIYPFALGLLLLGAYISLKKK